MVTLHVSYLHEEPPIRSWRQLTPRSQRTVDLDPGHTRLGIGSQL
jgi:hypothetical protein